MLTEGKGREGWKGKEGKKEERKRRLMIGASEEFSTHWFQTAVITVHTIAQEYSTE